MKIVNVALVSLSFAALTTTVGCGGAGDASSGDSPTAQAVTATYSVTSTKVNVPVVAPATGSGIDYPQVTITAFPAAAKAINAANAAQFGKEVSDFTTGLQKYADPSDFNWQLESDLEGACNLYNTKANIISLQCGGSAGGGAYPDDYIEAFNWTIDASGAKPIALADVFSSTDTLKTALRAQLAASFKADGVGDDPTDYVGESKLSTFWFSISKEGHAQINFDISDAVPHVLIGEAGLTLDLSAVKSSLAARGPGAALLASAP